ncbi:hypothetical protein Tco_0083243 [Tanacetum coccineum]
MLKSASTSNLSLPFLMFCTSPSCGYRHSTCLVKNSIHCFTICKPKYIIIYLSVQKALKMSVWGDDKEALAFEEDDPNDLSFETNDKKGLAFEADDPEVVVFLPPDLENMYSGMSLFVKSSYHFSKCLGGPLLDTMSGELYIISSELLVSKEEGPSVHSKSKLLFELIIMILASQEQKML